MGYYWTPEGVISKRTIIIHSFQNQSIKNHAASAGVDRHAGACYNYTKEFSCATMIDTRSFCGIIFTLQKKGRQDEEKHQKDHQDSGEKAPRIPEQDGN